MIFIIDSEAYETVKKWFWKRKKLFWHPEFLILLCLQVKQVTDLKENMSNSLFLQAMQKFSG